MQNSCSGIWPYVGPDHGAHGCLLHVVSNRVNGDDICTIVGLLSRMGREGEEAKGRGKGGEGGEGGEGREGRVERGGKGRG